METSQKAVHEFGVFSSRVKSIYDETVTCFQEIKQTLPLNESEGDKDVLSTAALSEVQRALRKNPSVIFIGDRNCGKSSLLNEVLGGSYLPVHENPCTSRIVRIVFAEETYAELITRDGRVIETKFGFKKIPREFAVMSDADIKEGEKLQCTVKVGLNHELLRSGIELIYSPGRNENDELDSVLDKFLGDGTVPLIVYIIDGGTGLRKTDLKTINLLQEKFPQVSFMFVCNKVDTTSGASDYDRDSGDEDKDQVNAKELSVFHKLKAAKIIPSKAVLGSYPYFHAVSAKETKEARYKNEHNKATQMFQRFEKCLKENLEAAIKRDTKRAVDKLLVLQESFVTGVNIAHDKQKEETQSIRLQHIPDIFGEILNAEAALKNTLATLAANQQGMQSLIENKLRSLEQNFMRKAEQYEILSEGNIRGDVEKSTMQVGSPEVAFKILYSVYELNLPFARFVKDMRETILSETFNTLKDPLLQKINDPLAIASKTIMSLSEKLQHPAVSQIFQESYHIDFKENRDQGDQLLLDVLEDLFDSIGKIVTVAFRREISGPLSEVLPFGSGHGQIGQDIKDKENRREVVKVLLSRIDSRHVSEALIKECRDLFENMHDMLGKALLNLLNFVDVLSKDITSTQLKDLWDVHTPKVRALAIKGFALQFLMKKGPAELGDPVFCMCPTQIYECLSPHWSHCGMPSIVKVVEKSKVNDEVWKRISVDLINTWNISGRYGRVHPNLLRIHGWLMPHDDVLHIVMERAQTDLLTALHRRMSLEKRLKVAADVAQGLKAMHKVGYVYQDLKPETVLLMADGTAKINMAIPVRPLEETRLGCPFHISSEMYRDYNTGISLCSYDIYAFGMLLWVLCEGTGETRPQAFSRCLTNSAMQNAVDDGVVPERPPEATDACWDLMMKCWKNPESVKIDEILDLFQNGEGPATRDTTVPIEIWTRGHKALRAYQKALEDGETYDRRVPVMIVGQDRSGKTSLKKSLKGEMFDPNEGSTNGIDTCILMKEVWKAGGSVDSTDEKSSVEGRFARVAARLTKKNLEEEQSQEKPREEQPRKRKRQIFASKLNTDTDAPSAPKREESIPEKVPTCPESVPRTDSKLPKNIPNKALVESKPEGISRIPKFPYRRESENVESSSGRVSKVPKDVEDLLDDKSENLEIDSTPEFILWDFAGQSVFYTTHSLFLSRKAIYILTYDLSRELNAKAEPTVKINMFERKLPDSECGMTNMDYVHYWLSSIHAFSEGSDSPGGESKDLPPKLPAVFLVGTHADKCNDPKAVANQIMENLKDKPYKDHVVRKVFTVNNTLSGKGEGDDEVKRLWEEILKVAQQLPHMNEKIPLKWLLLEKGLKKLEVDGTNFTSLDIVRQKTHEVCNEDGEDHFRTVVDFFHDRHAVLHYNSTPQLDELVVLGHQWLINIFKEVITVKPLECQGKEFEEAWKALEEKGELRLELVKHVWEGLVPKKETITSLLQILQKFSLTCEWVKPDGSEVHLVPSMLMSKADSRILEVMSSAEVPAFVVRFPTEYVPFGLFPRLVTRCLNWSPAGQNKIFRNFACFFCDKSECYQMIIASGLHKLYCVVIGKELTRMSGAGCTTDRRGLTTVCREVYTFVKNQLKEMKKEHLWMKGMDYTFCFECPKCSKRGGHELHQDADRNLDQCLHYLTEDEIVDVTKSLVCDKSGSLVMEHISRERYIPWLETLENKICEIEPSEAVLPSIQTSASQASLQRSQAVLSQSQATTSQANSSDQPAKSGRHLLLLSETWGWSEDGGLSQVTTEIAKQLAKIDKVRVTYMVAKLTKDQQDQAKVDGVDLVFSKPVVPCSPQSDLSCVPDNVRDVDVVISCGKAIGPPAQTIKAWCKCSWTHIACSSSEGNVEEETKLCKGSNVAVGLGSNVAEACTGKLRRIQKDVSEFTPGIFEEFKVCTQGPTEGRTFSVLAFYPPLDETSTRKKIYEIPAKAVGLLPDGKYKFRLIALCSPHSEPEKLKEILYEQGITPKQLIVRSHCPNIESCCDLLTEVDLLILPFLPSRSEDFGLVALQAISAGLPVLVSSTTGLGDTLWDVTNGGAFIVNSDDPEEWKNRILAVKEKGRSLRLTEANLLRENYKEKYSWEEQCKDLCKNMLSADAMCT